MNESFRLNPSDKASPLWRALAGYYTDRLAMLRAQNDAPKSAEDTASLRGRIIEVKALLALEDDPRQL